MTLTETLKRVCEAYGVPKVEFMSRSRVRRATQARAAFCYWARIKTGKSFPEIAGHIHMDHTTVVYHCNTYPEKVKRYRDDKAMGCMLAVNA